MKRIKNWVPLMLACLVAVGIYSSVVLSGTARDPEGDASQSFQRQISPKTHQDLTTAMHGEAFAYAKYMLYAEHARTTGHPELAALFENTARTELLEHFAEEAKLAGLVGSDENNLRDAIAGETYEVETMYPGFSGSASVAGDWDAAEQFAEIRNDEIKHKGAYKAALDALEERLAAPR